MLNEQTNNKSKKNKIKRTSKKTHLIGKRDYIDAETGEIQTMNVISCENRDFNFSKIWLSHVITSLDIIGNQKLRVATFILDNIDYENKFSMSHKQLSESSGISLRTVKRTMKALVESDFLIMLRPGLYRVNPNMIFKGRHAHRMSVLIEYSKEQSQNEKKERHLKLVTPADVVNA